MAIDLRPLATESATMSLTSISRYQARSRLLVVMRDGKSIETGTVGCEGVIGAVSGIASCEWQVRAIAQLPMFAGKLPWTELRRAVSSSKAIADLCLRSGEDLLTQAWIPRHVTPCIGSRRGSAGSCWKPVTEPRATRSCSRTNFSLRCSAFPHDGHGNVH
jgi:hypothetical protein